MENPWPALPIQSPFVLSEDVECIISFNSKTNMDAKYKINLELPPEPYSGNISAPIVLLQLNPGYSDKDMFFMIKDKNFALSMQKTRNQEVQEYPFYHLNPLYKNNPGFEYWSRILKGVLCKKTYKQCAHSFLLLQYFPYKSKENKKLPQTIPSQRYNFFILKQAIKRGALVIVMRSYKEWTSSVPELLSYENIIRCKNPRNPTISHGNLLGGAKSFEILLDNITLIRSDRL